MNKYLLVGIVAISIIVGGWWYFNQSNASPTSETTQSQTEQTGEQNANNQPSQPATSQTDVTANWKTFVNSRDGYSVKYPENEAEPSIDFPSGLKEFGFETSVSFIRYGGWADIYIFNGSVDEAISAYKAIDTSNGVNYAYEVSNWVIDGKNGKVIKTTFLGPGTSYIGHVEYRYFVEYRPGKILYIAGSQEFASTLKFL